MGAYMIIGTFAENGPDSCSGLRVRQYSEATLAGELNDGFRSNARRARAMSAFSCKMGNDWNKAYLTTPPFLKMKNFTMTIEQIERFIGTEPDVFSKIALKARTVEGIFIKAPDFLELKKKNFWRIVTSNKMEEYQKSKDINLSRIFNGQEFTKLAARS